MVDGSFQGEISMKNVITEVVERGFCIGCGVCVSLCPKKNLHIEWNSVGEFVPVSQERCRDGCSICLSVCPFATDAINESQISDEFFPKNDGMFCTPETGKYISCYSGHSAHRMQSASGGLASWFLEKLLSSGHIDAAICPSPDNDSSRLFTYKVHRSGDELAQCRGSIYYPVELSHVITYILENPGRYAITGLPCFIKGLRLASLKNSVLRERIAFTFGLVCGQMKSKAYTHYLASLCGVKGSLRSVHFRGKDLSHTASDFFFFCEDDSGSEGRIFWKEGVSKAWNSRFFTPNACGFCDDVFAETADIVFMDAWLPEFITDSKGTSLVLIRNQKLDELLKDNERNRNIIVRNISFEKIIQSQIGVLKFKRRDLAIRLQTRINAGRIPPKKRIPPGLRFFANFLQRAQISLLDDISCRSRRYAKEAGVEEISASAFQDKIRNEIFLLRCIQNLRLFLNDPARLLRKLGIRRNGS